MKGICLQNKRIIKKQKKILRKYVKKDCAFRMTLGGGRNAQSFLTFDRVSPSAHILDVVDDSKSGRIDGVDHFFYFADLPVRKDSEDNFCILVHISSLCIQESHAGIICLKKLCAYLFILRGKDQKLYFGFSKCDDFVDHDAAAEDHYDSVYSLKDRFGDCLKENDCTVTNIHDNRNRDTKFFVQDNAQNVKPAAGTVGAKNDPAACAKKTSGDQTAEERIPREFLKKMDLGEKLQKHREKKGHDQCLENEFLSCKDPSKSKKKDIDGKDDPGQGKANHGI